MHGLGVQVGPPRKVPPWAWQSDCVVMMQKITPGCSKMQQAPGQGLGVQVSVPGSKVPGGQPTPVKMKQALTSQHACVGIGQLLGVQVLPGAGVVPLGHGPAVVKHEPSIRQQARTHGLGTHVSVPGSVVPCGHGPNHRKQAVRSQQACDCGQGFGRHGVPPR